MSQIRRLIHEIHRRSIWQVLGIYAVTSWVIWQVVLSLYDGVGLPEWVPPTALVLLLVGLPIVLATAFIQEGGPDLRRGGEMAGAGTVDSAAAPSAAAPTGSAAERADSGPGPTRSTHAAAASEGHRRRAFFTWNRVITAGVLAFAVLGLAATGFMGMRTLGIGPAGTLVSRGVIDAREPILLADFESASRDTVLAAAVTEALRVDLEQATVVTLLQPAFAQDALRRMRRDPATRLTRDLAMELAVREGVKAVVVGDITAAGSAYVLTARVLGADGTVLTSARETAPADGVIAATDRLSRALRERLGESLRSIRSADPLAQVTTPSLEALRKYSQGVRAFDADPDRRRAILLLREAVEHDSAFAMAWRKLGVAYQQLDEDSTKLAIARAYEHRDRLTDRERYLTEGTYYDIVAGDTTRAMTAYETLLGTHPDEPTALNNLGRLHVFRGNLERAAELYGRAVEVSPFAAGPARNHIATLVRLGRAAEAGAAVEAYAERFPDHPYVPRTRGQLAAIRHDFDEAWRWFERLESHDGHEAEAGAYLAGIELLKGRHEAGFRRLRDALDGIVPGERLERDLTEIRALLDVTHRLDIDAARDRFVRQYPPATLAALPVDERPYFTLAMLHLTSGHTEEGRRYIDAWRRANPEAFEEPQDDVREVLAELGLAEGDPAPIVAHKRRAIADGCLPCRAHLGRAFEAAGMPDSAVVAYEQYLHPDDQPIWRLQPDRLWLPFVFQRLALLYEERDDGARAAEYHARLLELWTDPDPELRPRVDAARAALARLAAEN